MDTVCGVCGGTLKIKNHQRWIGYYCPGCKSGGSMPKKPGKWVGNNYPSGSLTKVKPRDYLPPLTQDKVTGPLSSTIDVINLTWHKETNTFSAEASDLMACGNAPGNIAGKEYYSILRASTNTRRNFFKTADVKDAEGELQYMEYTCNTAEPNGSILKLKVFND